MFLIREKPDWGPVNNGGQHSAHYRNVDETKNCAREDNSVLQHRPGGQPIIGPVNDCAMKKHVISLSQKHGYEIDWVDW